MMQPRTATLLCALFFTACTPTSTATGTTQQPSTDASTGASDADVTVQDAGPAVADSGVGRVDAGPANAPMATRSAVEWVHQGTPGSHGMITGMVKPLADGSVLVAASFAGTVALDTLTLTTNATPYVHMLLARVAPDGTVLFLRHIGDHLGSGLVAAELPDGRIVFASTSGAHAVLAPGTPEETQLGNVAGAVVFVTDANGRVLNAASLATGQVTVAAVAAGADGSVVVGGHVGGTVLFSNGQEATVAPGVFYPGQGFFAVLDGSLAASSVAMLTGTAASTVGQLLVDANGVTLLGDFGGYPRGVNTVFGPGTPGERSLTAVSSDDDPAMDIFLARYALTGTVEFARRIASYSNGPRTQQSWLDSLEPGTVTFLVEQTDGLVESDGEYRAPRPEVGAHHLVATFNLQGMYLGGTDFPQRVVRQPGGDGWVGLAEAWSGTSNLQGLAWSVPERTADTLYAGILVGSYRRDGALLTAAMMVTSVPAGSSMLSVHGSAPQVDGRVLVVLNGSAPITLLPDVGTGILLDPGPGFERMVFLSMAPP